MKQYIGKKKSQGIFVYICESAFENLTILKEAKKLKDSKIIQIKNYEKK